MIWSQITRCSASFCFIAITQYLTFIIIKNKKSDSFENDSNIEIKDFLNDIEAYDIIITNNNVAFKYDGNINSLLTKLNKIKLNSLKIYPQDIYQLGV